MDETPVAELRELLRRVRPGTLDPEVDWGVDGALASAWKYLDGGEAEGMDGEKVGRAVGMAWHPPLLIFSIERHGAMVQGSTRAEVHRWTIDTEAGTAAVARTGSRQVRPRAKNLAIEPLADKLTELIRAGIDHEWLKWGKNRDRVGIATAQIPTLAHSFKQTLTDRRRRLRAKLTEALDPLGWIPNTGQYYWFVRAPD